MSNGRKFSLIYGTPILFAILFCTITLFTLANYSRNEIFYNALTAYDTIPVAPAVQKVIDTIPPAKIDTGKTVQKIDTIDVKVSQDSLDAPISYAFSDSMVLDIPAKRITLYNKANMKYKDLDLDAYTIEMDQQSKLVTATYTKDTAGNMVGRPHFVQGENTMDMDSMVYNIETQKGLTKSTYTNQGEIFFYTEKTKKISENEFFGFKGRFTTCNLDTPHFAFKVQKLKLVNKKLAVTGPVHPEFEGVPVPVYLPFGFFPLTQGRHSGLLPPSFSANDQFGLGLEGLGYYKVLNDHLDMMLRGDIYSYGGWRATFTPTYRVRYRYYGQMNLSVQNTRFLSSSGKQTFETNRSFNIAWSHSVDSKARPGQTFSASVNAGSTKYNQYLANNPTRNFQNQLNSTISFQKNWDNKFNLALNAGHDQNNYTGLVNIRLPDGSFTVNTFYPFQKKEFVGESKWYEKFGIGLNTQFRGQSSFYDSLFTFKQLIDTFQWGAQHSIPLTLSLPQLGPFQIAPGISIQNKMYAQEFYRKWDDNTGKMDTTVNKGFYSRNDVSFSLGVSTAMFGTYSKFGKNSSVKAIRHVIRPTVSASYKPDMAKNDYYSTRVDSAGRELRFSKFDGSLYGPFSEGRFGGIGFTLDNNLEMKVRDKSDSSGEGTKKIKLLDGFGLSGNYNFLADSFKLSNISLYLRSTLWEKVNITAGANLDPYITDKEGFRVNKYAWQDGSFSLGQITSGNIAISTSFQSKKADKKKKEVAEDADERLPLTMDEEQAQLNYIRNNPGQFADFEIPWSINLSYSLNFVKLLKSDYSGYETQVASSLNVGGDFNLTPKWKVGMNAYYDFKGSSLQSLTMFISREMHCWQMTINVSPVGLYKFFSININPKSGLLRDLKVNRTRYFYGGD